MRGFSPINQGHVIFPFLCRHFCGRVFVSLADGHIVVFRRQTTMLTSLPPATVTPTPAAVITPSQPSESSFHSTIDLLPQPPDSTPSANPTPQRNTLSIEEELSVVDGLNRGVGGYGGGNWDLSEAVVIRCGSNRTAVKSLTVVAPALALWAAYGTQILVIDTTGFQKLAT